MIEPIVISEPPVSPLLIPEPPKPIPKIPEGPKCPTQIPITASQKRKFYVEYDSSKDTKELISCEKFFSQNKSTECPISFSLK